MVISEVMVKKFSSTNVSLEVGTKEKLDCLAQSIGCKKTVLLGRLLDWYCSLPLEDQQDLYLGRATVSHVEPKKKTA